MEKRQIKFRAWDKENKTMLDDVCTQTDDFTDMLNETFRMWSDPEIGTLELMQFTGLLDKNGKEIYEGDIVFDEDGEFSKTCKIEWDEIGAKFFGIAIEDGDSYEMQEIDGKIIGNIYENPEILNTPTPESPCCSAGIVDGRCADCKELLN